MLYRECKGVHYTRAAQDMTTASLIQCVLNPSPRVHRLVESIRAFSLYVVNVDDGQLYGQTTCTPHTLLT